MDASKDYYAVLGLLPSAEESVIRAAYRVLAQRYHPDRTNGTGDTTSRMAELNEAYGVLSDPPLRAEYDRRRGAGAKSGEGFFGGQAQTPPSGQDPIEADWKLAVRYYPDLIELEDRLSKFSWKLAYSFRISMLETQRFEQSGEVADSLEKQFMRVYFGDNERILSFARSLIESGRRDAAKALNEAVRVLGSNANPQRVINKIRDDFFIDQVGEAAQRREDVRKLTAIVSRGGAANDDYVRLFRLLGGEIHFENKLFSTKCFTEMNGVERSFAKIEDFRRWIHEELLRDR